MKKGNKIIISIGIIVLALVLFFLFALYNNGYSGLHRHKEAADGQIKVACVGDSITYGHGIKGWAKNNYPAQLQKILGDGYHVANFGHSGKTLSNDGDQPYTESEQYQLSLEYDADIVVIMLGTNDSKPENWTGALDFVEKYDKFINSYKGNNPDVEIIICTPAAAFFHKGESDGMTSYDIQPKMVEIIKNELRTFALLNGYKCVDVYSLTENHKEWFRDNVHPSKDGAKAIAEAVAEKIKNKE
ncbi:MAG: sialate O-acetylesterase [Clostridia bacterium]|nr:sialate O-acetylesterase [Clostridia bacterium]